MTHRWVEQLWNNIEAATKHRKNVTQSKSEFLAILPKDGAIDNIDIIIHNHMKKLVMALDLIDQSEFAKKGHVTPHHINESLRTWLPVGEIKTVSNTANYLGYIMETKQHKKLLKVIKQRYSKKEQDCLVEVIHNVKWVYY